MRQPEFEQWLRDQRYAESTITTYGPSARTVEKAEKIDLDQEYQKDGLASLIALYRYTEKDRRNKRLNPTNLNVALHTLGDYGTALKQYRKFCLSDGDYSVSVEPESESSTDSGATFGLERDMQDAMRETITQLESGLEIIDGGVERKVDSGFIDILAKDSNGAFVVIELKAGKASDSVIAQTLGYMVDIADAEGLEINQVRGIIVAKSFNKRIETAARAVPSLALKAYTYSFDFN